MPGSDPVTSIANAVDDLEQLIRYESSLTHPLMYMWRIHTMINHLTHEIKKDPRINPDDLVHAACHDLDAEEQEFILHVVKQKLNIKL